MTPRIPAIVIMGVAGCGKSSVGRGIAQRCEVRLIEGDDFHPPANIARMSAGIALTDADRAGWLDTLARLLAERVASGEPTILACSSLKRRYRDRLREAVPDLGFVYLELNREEAAQRVMSRQGHFMQASLIDSQFADLEPPRDEPNVLSLDGSLALDDLIEESCRWWRATPASERSAR
jgi:gluconokinase